ncbi:MAG: esterase-like activity of phytase family protein [Candidatus Promineifilaceae bacterium]
MPAMNSIYRHYPISLLRLAAALVLIILIAGCSGQADEQGSEPIPSEEPTIEPVASVQPANNPTPTDEPTAHPVSTPEVELLGMVEFKTGYRYGETEVGGLSGITYNPEEGHYYVLSDDRGGDDPPRFYVVDIDLSDGKLDDGDVIFLDVVALLDEEGEQFKAGTIDPESIEYLGPDALYISSEGNLTAQPLSEPFVAKFKLSGEKISSLPLPEKFLPDSSGTVGIRDNKAFESLTSTPSGELLYTALENALQQDGTIPTFEKGSPSRLLEFNPSQAKPGREFVYMVEPIPVSPKQPGYSADNGLAELQALDDGRFLALERSYVEGFGNTVRIFVTNTDGASEVSSMPSLPESAAGETSYTPMGKHLLVDMVDLGIQPDNLEAMAFGPRLPDGRQSLILVSDNNFNPSQTTQFIVLALNL